LVTRRFTAKGGEIDIVALDGDTIVFVEVKLSGGGGSSPEEAIDHRKARRLAGAGQAYLAQIEEPQRPIRFDLIAIDPSGLRHIPD
ncbi:YraN family protein, partial [Acinetobacter baumannii]